ncbi:MAG: lysophospholipid acyltransferase family protein [Phycisphaerales bacterium]|nr:lysophospholipid acyltransferase family protein [Phycisphaerales bacterium]
MAKQRNDLNDRLTYLALRLVSMALHCFPVNANLRTAALIGDILFRFDRRHRLRAMEHLRRSFPEYSQEQCLQLTRQSMQHLVMLGVEVLFSTRLIRRDSWRRYIHLHQLGEALDILLRRQSPVILITGHYGNWEVLGYTLATLGFETAAVARPLDNPYINQWLLGVRQQKGQRILDKKGATSEITDILETGGAVAFIADQNAGTKGLFVDFFGRKASTYKSIALLAMRYRAPVVVGYGQRLNNQFDFRIGINDIIHPHQWDEVDDPLRYITQRYTTAIENFIREDPGQYLWAHRRWKTRPKGEPPAENGVA